MSEEQDYSWVNNISDRIESIIYTASQLEDIAPIADDLLSMMDRYMSDDMKALKNLKGDHDIEIRDKYDENIHRVRTIILTLYDLEAVPSPQTDYDRLVYSDIKTDDTTEVEGVLQSVNFRSIMMYYLYQRIDLTEQLNNIKNPYAALHHYLDVGYGLLAPYVTTKDKSEWEKQNQRCREGMGDNDEDKIYRARNGKISIQSRIMDREKLQFKRRTVDEMEFQMPSADFREEVEEEDWEKKAKEYKDEE